MKQLNKEIEKEATERLVGTQENCDESPNSDEQPKITR